MFKNRKKFITLIIGLAFILFSLVDLLLFSIPTMGEKTFKFQSEYEGKTTTLSASYNEVKDSEYAVLICPGFSCDRQKWRPFTNLFVSNGYTTMRFDYSGQGSSYGTIGFNNAKTNHVPTEIEHAMQVLHERSGVDYDHIILVGHSMGGRSILRLLYNHNENVEGFENIPGNVILMSAEVNYNFNAQASLFAGTSDAEEYPWNDFSSKHITGTNLYLFGSTADDIVSDEDVIALFKRVGGSLTQDGGKVAMRSQTNGVGSKITIGITSGILHSYEMYSPEFATFVNASLKDITGVTAQYNPVNMLLIYVGWFTGLAGLFFTLYSLNIDEKWVATSDVPVLMDAKKFLLRKLLLWLPALVIMAVICCVSAVMPFGSPVMNIIFMGSIAGYGMTMLVAYRKGKFKGAEGKLPKLSFKANKTGWLVPLVIVVALCAFVWYAFFAGMYRLVPLNARWFWLAFATVIMTIGYYVSGCETDMLENAGVSKGKRVLYNLIQYVPLFLLTIGYLIIQSYSGLIGQIQNMVIMYIFCIPLGNYFKKKTGNRLYGALITAFVFQASMITSTALIALF